MEDVRPFCEIGVVTLADSFAAMAMSQATLMWSATLAWVASGLPIVPEDGHVAGQ